MRQSGSVRPLGWSLVCLGCVFAGLLALTLAESRPAVAGGVPEASPPGGTEIPITAAEVDAAVRAAAAAVAGEGLAVAVVDRTGAVLAVFRRAGATAADQELALSLARTAAFFGENAAPLTSRTVRFISGIHFPPGVTNQENADLYGIENTNRVSRGVTFNPGRAYPDPLNIDGTGPSLGITTGKVQPMDANPRAVNPGGVPLYRQDFLRGFPDLSPTSFAPLGITQIGGIGVAGVPPDAAEFAAVQGSKAGEQPVPTQGARIGQDTIQQIAPRPKTVYIAGISLPLSNPRNFRRPRGVAPGGPFPGTGAYRVGPVGGTSAPDGFLAGPVGNADLTAAEVVQIIRQCDDIAKRTRAAIRLPLGARARFVFAVGGLGGEMLAVFRQVDSTIFSIDVAVAKARNVVFFSNPALDPTILSDRSGPGFPDRAEGLPPGTAVTARSISFAAQPLFPAGINVSRRPGPFFQLFLDDLAFPGSTSPRLPQPNIMTNGILFFPGSIPLYRNGRLIGGLGVSGDGVAQDDFVTFNGAQGFLPPPNIRSDNFTIRSVRIPFLKFPRNPTL